MLKDKATWKVHTESGEFVNYNLSEQPLQSSWGQGYRFQRQMENARKGAQTKKKSWTSLQLVFEFILHIIV